MRQCRAMLYVKTENSTDSTWMPWELGYFDALKSRVAILPVVLSARPEFNGNEYLGLYPYVDVQQSKPDGTEHIWVNRTASSYTTFEAWLADPKV